MPQFYRRRGRTLIAVAMVILMIAAPALAEPRATTVESCAACHGDDGIARDSEVPNIAGQNDRYLYNQMMAFRSGKRTHKEMRFMARSMSVEEIAAVATYYSSLPAR